MTTIIKHLRVYLALMRFSVSRSMEFRVDFFFRFIMDCVFYALSIAFFGVLFLHSDNLAGWEPHEVLLFLAGGFLIDALYMTFIARSTWEIPHLVNRGNLDFQILRPVNSLFFVLTRHFELASFLNMVVAIGLIVYAASSFPEPISISQMAGFLFLLLNGVVLTVALRMLTILPVFWTHSEMGFHMLYMSLEQVSERPEVMFRGAIRTIFITVLPFLVITSFPARWFFGELSWLEALYAVMITTFFALLVVFIWYRGLRIYSSASS